MEAIRTSETSVKFYQYALRHISVSYVRFVVLLAVAGLDVLSGKVSPIFRNKVTATCHQNIKVKSQHKRRFSIHLP
jgi:hypothetical protein